MFWAGIRHGVTSELTLCYGDPEAKKKGVTPKVYKEILEEELPKLMEPSIIFMQDNASIHTSKLLKEWLKEMRFEVLEWPAYSPDLNPIENLWGLLKRKIVERYPELGALPRSEASLKKLCDAATTVWLDFGQQLVDDLIDSMPRRIQAVIQSKGWYTKY